MLWRNRINISKYLIEKKVNRDNINVIITEFEDYLSNGKGIKYDELYDSEKEIYDLLRSIKEKI